MTGTINPTTTIGPVGGIPQKLEGAASAGKKTVLVPLGERYDYDMKNNEMVDLVQRGTELGLTVKEVADVYEAYPYFTGREIPKSGTTATGTPAISPAAEAKLKECIQNNVSEALGALDAFQQESQEAQDANIDYANAAQDAMSKADNYVLQGSSGASYGQSHWPYATRRSSAPGPMATRTGRPGPATEGDLPGDRHQQLCHEVGGYLAGNHWRGELRHGRVGHAYVRPRCRGGWHLGA
jgi:predicted S18 family serine protease